MVPFSSKSEGLGRGSEARGGIRFCFPKVLTELGHPLPAGYRVPGRAGCPQICPPIVCHHLWRSTICSLEPYFSFQCFLSKAQFPERCSNLHLISSRVSQCLAKSQGLKGLGYLEGGRSSGNKQEQVKGYSEEKRGDTGLSWLTLWLTWVRQASPL